MFKIYPFETHDLFFGMALDECLLEDALSKKEGFFRCSAFSEPGITIGRLQKIKLSPPKEKTWTRRPTGGGLVQHKDDLILSLSLPLPQKTSFPLIYQNIHEAILRALKTPTALDLSLWQTKPPSPTQEKDCFSSPVRYDILLDKKKLVGGALKKNRGHFLYQGSIQMPALIHDEALRNAFLENLLHDKALLSQENPSDQSFSDSASSIKLMSKKMIPTPLREKALLLSQSKYQTLTWKMRL